MNVPNGKKGFISCYAVRNTTRSSMLPKPRKAKAWQIMQARYEKESLEIDAKVAKARRIMEEVLRHIREDRENERG